MGLVNADRSSDRPWWRRLDGVPPGATTEPKGRADAWALRRRVLASLLGALVLLGVGVVLDNLAVGVVVSVSWAILHFAILDLRRRRAD